jgi:hypothetical protein
MKRFVVLALMLGLTGCVHFDPDAQRLFTEEVWLNIEGEDPSYTYLTPGRVVVTDDWCGGDQALRFVPTKGKQSYADYFGSGVFFPLGATIDPVVVCTEFKKRRGMYVVGYKNQPLNYIAFDWTVQQVLKQSKEAAKSCNLKAGQDYRIKCKEAWK